MFEDLRDTSWLSKGVGDTGGPYWVSPYKLSPLEVVAKSVDYL
jgi:hypothetical protein